PPPVSAAGARSVGSGSGSAQANDMGPSNDPPQRCGRGAGFGLRAVGPPARAAPEDHPPRRSFESDTVSPARHPPGTGTCGPPLGPTGRDADRLDCTGQSPGAWRGRKGSWTQPRPGVMPGVRGKFPGCRVTELNPTGLEE